MVHVIQPAVSTSIVIGALLAVLAITARRRREPSGLSVGVTQEIKGLAVLMIVVSHIGFFLSDERSFLYPLSTMAGVGVNIFLLLSGYGLTLSQSAKPLPIGDWYRKRLPKLYIPMTIVVLCVVILDILFTSRGYSLGYVVRSVFGWFPRADIDMDLDSPLWYFSFIIFYYLLFPVLFSRRRAWLSAIGLFIAGMLLVDIARRTGLGVTPLYRTHIAAFPLGVMLAWLGQTKLVTAAIRRTGPQIRRFIGSGWRAMTANALVLVILLAVITYFAKHSAVGSGPIQEQFISLVTVLFIVLLFSLKRFEFKFFALIGFYSYEIYLLHWPLLSRHDFLYSWLPGWLATIVWLLVLLVLSWLLQHLANTWLPSAVKRFKLSLRHRAKA